MATRLAGEPGLGHGLGLDRLEERPDLTALQLAQGGLKDVPGGIDIFRALHPVRTVDAGLAGCLAQRPVKGLPLHAPLVCLLRERAQAPQLHEEITSHATGDAHRRHHGIYTPSFVLTTHLKERGTECPEMSLFWPERSLGRVEGDGTVLVATEQKPRIEEGGNRRGDKRRKGLEGKGKGKGAQKGVFDSRRFATLHRRWWDGGAFRQDNQPASRSRPLASFFRPRWKSAAGL